MAVIVDETQFTLKYDGGTAAANRMDVRSIAPALIAVGELFREAYATVEGPAEPSDPDQPRLRLDIEPFQPGSFTVRFFLEVAIQGRGSIEALVLPNLVNLNAVLDTVIKCLDIIKRLRGASPRASMTPDETHIRIATEDGEIELTTAERTLITRRTWRRAARDAVSPVGTETASELTIDVGGERRFRADADDVDSFVVPAADAPLTVNEVEVVANIVAPSFRRGEKWRISFYEATHWAAIADETFIAEVEAGTIRLGSRDVMRCRMRVEQLENDAGGITVDYTVLRVIRYEPQDPPEQPALLGPG